jgi:hypothetical protein
MTQSVKTPPTQEKGATTMDNIAKSGLKYVKDRARRDDPVGEATYRALGLVSDGLGVASKALRQLGEATKPPARARKELASESTPSKKGAAGKPRAKTA